jgi:hypothetical protein
VTLVRVHPRLPICALAVEPLNCSLDGEACWYVAYDGVEYRCAAYLGPWGTWRSCITEVVAFVAATERLGDHDPATWHALALYWCADDDREPAGIDELLDAAGWSPC